MSFATINNIAISRGRVTLRAAGAWDASLDVTAASVDKIQGASDIRIGATQLRGTATVTGADQGNEVTLRVTGGAGGLNAAALAHAYGNPVTLRSALTDALSIGGESLSNDSPANLDATLAQWVRIGGTVADSIWRICEAKGLAWRILLDGSVWVGVDNWPAADLKDIIIETEEPANKRTVFAPKELSILPGTSWGEQHITSVEYTIDDTILRGQANFGVARGAMEEVLGAIIGSETAHLDYHGTYLARIVGQNGDGTLELRPYVSERWPGLSRVQVRRGIPGLTDFQVSTGGDAIFTFENGSPEHPRVVGFDNLQALKFVLTCPSIFLGSDSARAIAMADLTQQALDALVQWGGSHVHPVSGPNTGVPASPPIVNSNVASLKVNGE